MDNSRSSFLISISSLSSSLLPSSSSSSSTSSITTLVDEAVKTYNTIIYTPTCVGRRWRSGRCIISGRFFSSEQLTRDDNYLRACFLCKKALSKDKDIFMYRGNVPFCSEDCREEQIDMDESLEQCQKFSNHTSTGVKSSSSTMTRKPSIIMNPSNHMRTDTAIIAG